MRQTYGRLPRSTLFLFLGLVCGGAAAQETPTLANGVVRSPGNADWATSPDDARARAAAQQKFVFVQFDRAGRECGNCRRMEALLYPAFDFEALLIPMVPVKVQLDSAEGKELARKYGIREAPAVLVTASEGRVVFQMEGFTNAPGFYRQIHRDLDAYRAFAKKVEAQDIPHLSPEEALKTGRELYERLDPGAALPRLERAASAPKATADVRDQAREILAATQLDLGQITASRQANDRLIATTKDKNRRERAELFRAQLPLAENKPEEALALYKKFQKDHPLSPYLGEVNGIVERLAKSTPKP